jgi:uncharacterized membrane protein YbhN (UPF0104 family)
MKTTPPKKSLFIRWAVYLVLVGLLLMTVFAQHTAISDALHVARTADGAWLTAAIIAFGASLGLAAGLLVLLAGGALRYGRTLLVQSAGLFANKLLPAGSGALGVNYLYLRRLKFSRQAGGVIVASNNLLGLIGHLLLLLALFVCSPGTLTQIGDSDTRVVAIGVAVAALVSVLTVVLVVPRSRRAIFKTFSELRRLLVQWPKLIGAVTVSMSLTICYALCLLCSARAIGLDITIGQAFVALTLSVFAASAVPTPGGIGSAEAGAYFGLKAFGIGDDVALAAAILYRFVTFWLPLGVGSVAFWYVSKQGYLLKKL